MNLVTPRIAPREDPAGSLARRFQQLYGRRAAVFCAPGRINLIGEHTDYNDGFVLPAAIGFYTWVAVAERNDRKLAIRSEQFSDAVEFKLNDLNGPPRKHWSDYVRGVAAVLQDRGHRLNGADLLIHGNVPLGAGLSSSASLEVSVLLALATIAGVELSPLEMALTCQRAENQYAGARCGIMDQFISCLAQADHALLLDCRFLTYKAVCLPPHVRLVICNSMVKHELAGGEYNKRREACEKGVELIRAIRPEVRALRDVTLDDLDRYVAPKDATVYRRCRHVVAENPRVLDAAEALNRAELGLFGKLMFESHQSLAEDYEVSCRELNILVELAHKCGVYGARMTGGGFGGCTINLVQSEAAEEFKAEVGSKYRQATGQTPDIFICRAVQGAIQAK